MKRIKLIVNTKSKKYPIIIGQNAITELSNIFKSSIRKIFKNIKSNKR